MTVTVTAYDIIAGRRWVPTQCPLAYALRRAFNESDVAVTSWGVARVGSGAKKMLVSLPDKAFQFVDDFDNRRPVEPFVFGAVVS